jgi:hypothetical protein
MKIMRLIQLRPTLPCLHRVNDFNFASKIPRLGSVRVNVGIKINGREKGQHKAGLSL